MSTAEILAQLPHLSPDERAEVQAKLDELAASSWIDDGALSTTDKDVLNATIAAYERAPDAGGPWNEVKARIQARIRS